VFQEEICCHFKNQRKIHLTFNWNT